MNDSSLLHLRIHGRVQGVGYRQSLAARARALGLRGWVRNRGDGSVEAVLLGDAAGMRQALDWVKRGPPAARVDRVEQARPEPGLPAVGTSFETLPTL